MCWQIAILVATACVGCDQVFELDPRIAADASPPFDTSPDRDNDGVLNELDICPDAADPTQHDEDGDGLGDACDPCALDASTTGDLDSDGIDDTCDPRPLAADCLVLFDSFAGFLASDWEQVPGSMVVAQPDSLRLVTPGPRTGLHPTAINGPHSLRAKFVMGIFAPGDQLRLLGSSMVDNSDIGHGCWIERTMLSLVNVVNGPVPTDGFVAGLDPADTILVSMIHDAPTTFSCNVQIANHVATLSEPIAQSPGGDEPMIVMVGGEITITALAIYAAQLGACPAPTIR